MREPAGGWFTYTYDGASRQQKVINPYNETTTFVYDGAGKEISHRLGNGMRITYTYDAADRLTVIDQQTSAGVQRGRFTYTYDKVGNRRDVIALDGVTTWTYDTTYRLTSEHRTGVGSYNVTHTYDPVGNRLVEQTVPNFRTTFTYDGANQLVNRIGPSGATITTYTYDGAGNLTGPSPTYSWNVDNRLTQVQGSETITYQYNADRLLTNRTRVGTGSSTYLWDLNNLLRQKDGATNNVFTYMPRLYGSLVSQRVGALSSFYLFDALGSANALTNSSGVISATYRYRAYGRLLSGSTSTNPFVWVGRYGYLYDDVFSEVIEEDHYYVRARHYDPPTVRWLSQDPLGLQGSQWNLYMYADNSPLNAADPSGLVTIGVVPFIESCGQREINELTTLVRQVCDWINGNKPSDDWPDPSCIGPNLSNCLKKICSGKINVLCIRKCTRLDAGCAEAVYYKPQSPPPQIPQMEVPDLTKGPRCQPTPPPAGYEYLIRFCWTKPGGDGMWNTNPCGGTKKGVVLHELIHYCNELHKYHGGTGATEACERRCFGNVDENEDRFRKTPKDCKCECTPTK
jgi:RHS repeat-associated protein